MSAITVRNPTMRRGTISVNSPQTAGHKMKAASKKLGDMKMAVSVDHTATRPTLSDVKSLSHHH